MSYLELEPAGRKERTFILTKTGPDKILWGMRLYILRPLSTGQEKKHQEKALNSNRKPGDSTIILR